jgi:hypothetical protein
MGTLNAISCEALTAPTATTTSTTTPAAGTPSAIRTTFVFLGLVLIMLV